MSHRPAQATLPPADLLRRQAAWLAPARARLLRNAGIARRRRVLDLGAGQGAVTGELVRRAGGPVVAVDIRLDALRSGSDEADRPTGTGAVDTDARAKPPAATTAPPSSTTAPSRACADACSLPFPDAAFDLVFTQLVWLWIGSASRCARAAAEVWRVLAPGGAVVALEPDYGGAIEFPPSIAVADIWIAALERAGADPFAGRRLPALLSDHAFDVHVDLLPQLHPPAPERFDLLRGLPLTDEERRRVGAAARVDAALACEGAWAAVAHVPFVLITATRR